MFHQQAGFTLIEIMVTLAVTVIVLAVAVPSYVNFTRANRLTTQVNNFVQALHLARNEAVRAGGATLCASNNQTDCVEGGDWLTGWIIFADYNANGTKDSDEDIIRVGDAFPPGFNITAKKTAAIFGPQGFVALQGDVELSFLFCNERTGAGAGRKVTLNRAGRPSTENYDDCK